MSLKLGFGRFNPEELDRLRCPLYLFGLEKSKMMPLPLLTNYQPETNSGPSFYKYQSSSGY